MLICSVESHFFSRIGESVFLLLPRVNFSFTYKHNSWQSFAQLSESVYSVSGFFPIKQQINLQLSVEHLIIDLLSFLLIHSTLILWLSKHDLKPEISKLIQLGVVRYETDVKTTSERSLKYTKANRLLLWISGRISQAMHQVMRSSVIFGVFLSHDDAKLHRDFSHPLHCVPTISVPSIIIWGPVKITKLSQIQFQDSFHYQRRIFSVGPILLGMGLFLAGESEF